MSNVRIFFVDWGSNLYRLLYEHMRGMEMKPPSEWARWGIGASTWHHHQLVAYHLTLTRDQYCTQQGHILIVQWLTILTLFLSSDHFFLLLREIKQGQYKVNFAKVDLATASGWELLIPPFHSRLSLSLSYKKKVFSKTPCKTHALFALAWVEVTEKDMFCCCEQRNHHKLADLSS